MFRPARMCRLDCIIAEEKKAELINALHEKGITQIEYFGDKAIESLGVERDAPPDKVVEVSNLLIRLRKIADILSAYEPKVEKNILADMLGVDYTERKKVKERTYDEVVKRSKVILEKIEDEIDEISKDMQKKSSAISSLTEKLKVCSAYEGIKETIESFGKSKYLYSVIGTLPAANVAAFDSKLNEKFGKDYILEIQEDNANDIVGVCVRNEKSDELEIMLRESGFEKAKIDGGGKISNIVATIRSDLDEYKKGERRDNKRLNELYGKYYKDILISEELLGFEKDKCEVFMSLGKTKMTSVTRLWVPQKQCEEAEDIIRKKTNNKCVIEKETELEEAPILLENNAIAKPFEGLTKMFALPKYNEIDPTFFIVPTFCLFFGLMLTDAIYGVVLIIAGIVVRKTMGKRPGNAMSAGFIMIGTGLAAIFFGILTGSYLGDFVAKYLLGTTSNKIALWIDPMYGSNAMTVLIVACSMGFVHIMFGHFLGIYDKKRRGMLKDAIFEHVPWYVFIGGVAVALLSMTEMLPGFYSMAGGVVAIIGLLMLIKGLGFMAFIDLIGLVGNTLSYARLLAMSLTTAGIAMSFNFLAGMMYNMIPYVGIVIAAVIFIFGHTINILINSLGAFVHSLRLQYVEHFGTYYSGGGMEFKPFREERKYSIANITKDMKV